MVFGGARVRCSRCGSPRLFAHPEWEMLAIAHVDCDAFYATIEKRDDPSLAARPVIVGGGRRGVVSTACYIARIHGVRSAMPMFKALAACPNAVVIKPNMEKYAKVSREVRRLMLELTPLVEPVSIDEAFLDLSGTQALHGTAPAMTLMRFADRVEREIGVTVSIGLSFNKFLAKIASDLDKPRGFSAIGQGEALDFLGPRPVTILPGVGKAAAARFAKEGVNTILDLRTLEPRRMLSLLGNDGARLLRLANARDERRVTPEHETKSVSAETTFDADTRDPQVLLPILMRLSEKVSSRMKAKNSRRLDSYLEAQDQRFPARHAGALNLLADESRRPHLSGGARPDRARADTWPLSAHRRRHVGARVCARGRPRRSRRSIGGT